LTRGTEFGHLPAIDNVILAPAQLVTAISKRIEASVPGEWQWHDECPG